MLSTRFWVTLWPFYKLVQEKRNCSVLAMELHLSCTNPSITVLHDHIRFISIYSVSHCMVSFVSYYTKSYYRQIFCSRISWAPLGTFSSFQADIFQYVSSKIQSNLSGSNAHGATIRWVTNRKSSIINIIALGDVEDYICK